MKMLVGHDMVRCHWMLLSAESKWQTLTGSQPPSVRVVQEGYGGGPSDTSLLSSFGQHIAAKI